ncbi:succinylglutamate desuccinylase/aspartoacylase family protein [Spongiivirga sp. MCCC 1A20706]|uniref:succinylglutamate desuccinylase/aspartoacylase family protein n=1 Tax=Spongiivirga sp. MCCC 1A20706 TaxID=3160963 RepID=UPI00397786E5
MPKVYSKALNRTIEVERIIGKFKGKGPTVIFTGGIHGNEPSGVFALKQVIDEIDKNKVPLKGSLYAISGNIWALQQGKRFHKEDLNRLWTKKRISAIKDGSFNPTNNDEVEQVDLYRTIKSIMNNDQGPYYFMDLHTTSGMTIPFLTVNDSLLNRKFIEQYPVPTILGIEEYLEGPLLSYINELGYVAFGYEAGQHDELSAIENNVAFIYLSLVYAGVIDKNSIDYYHYYDLLAKNYVHSKDIYEIFYHYKIQPGEKFEMLPGFVNFEKVRKGQQLGESDQKPIISSTNGRLFMPLYQSSGEDGFYTIKAVPRLFLDLSKLLRNIKFDRFLSYLPGIKWESDTRDALIVNRRIAIFFAKQFFHLLGYRSKELDHNHYRMKNREAASRTEDYEESLWFNN